MDSDDIPSASMILILKTRVVSTTRATIYTNHLMKVLVYSRVEPDTENISLQNLAQQENSISSDEWFNVTGKVYHFVNSL